MNKNLLITEEEKKRILNLHKRSIENEYLYKNYKNKNLLSENKNLLKEYTIKDIQSLLVNKYKINIGNTGFEQNGIDGDFGNLTKNAVIQALNLSPNQNKPEVQPEVKPEVNPQQPEVKPEVNPQQPEVKPEVNPQQPEVKPESVYKYPKVKEEMTRLQLVQYVLASRSLFLKLQECLNQQPLLSLGITNATYQEHSQVSGGNMEQLITQENYQNSIEIDGKLVSYWDIVNPNGNTFVNIHKKIGEWYITANAYDSLESIYNGSNGDKSIRVFCCKKTGCSEPMYFDGNNCKDIVDGLVKRTSSK